jgi:glycosyltransferase involved in cell wall biosynthesis
MFLHFLDSRAVSRLVVALSAELADMGFEVSLLCTARWPGAVAVPDSVAFEELRLGSRRTALSVPALAARLRALRPDVVFSHGNGPNRAAILARLLSRGSFGVITVEHNHYGTFFGGRRRLRDAMTALLYPRADRVTGVSPGVVAELEERFPAIAGRTYVLPSVGPDPRRVEAVASAGERPDHEWYRAEARPLVVCSEANVLARKGQDVLVRALPAVRAELGDVALVLVGRLDDETFARELRRLMADLGVEDHVWLAGYQPDPLPFIAHADVFALASMTEGMPMVLTEALACGVPAVSTDCPAGPRYVLDDGRCGLLVPVGDADAMAAAIVEVTRDTELRSGLVERGRQRAACFTPRAVALAYVAEAEAVKTL